MSIDEPHLLNIPTELAETEFTEMISINIICRLCANQNDKLLEIFGEDGVSNDLSGKMNLYLPIKVSQTDNLPLQCCWQCASTLLAWHDLVVTSVEADRRLRSYQFITEKQLVEISYAGTEGLLANSTDDNLQNNRKDCSENCPIEVKDSHDKENVLLDLAKRAKNHIESEYSNDRENTATTQVSLRDNFTEEQTLSTEFSDNEEIGSTRINRSNAKIENANLNKRLKIVFDNDKTYVNFDTKTCNICESTFTSNLLLRRHTQKVHNIKATKSRRKKCDIVASFTCSFCNRCYTRKHDLHKHVKVKHPCEEIPKNNRKNADIINKCKITTTEGTTLFQCDICSQTFKKTYSLTRHRTIHSNSKPHCCHLCGNNFRLTSLLIRHINEFHHNKRKFKCAMCDKVFKNKYTLDEHINIHKNVRPYVCDICGKSFRQNASLYVHKQFHSKHSPYVCQVCDKKFKSKQNFKEHSLTHTGYKPYLCQQCGVSFKSKYYLNRHNKCHTPVSCDKCGVVFGQVRYMKRHRKGCMQSLDALNQKKTSEGVIIKN